MNEPVSDDLQQRIEDAVRNPRNLGEMKEDADAIGKIRGQRLIAATWSACGSSSRKKGDAKSIDRATFQTFGCQTAIAVASVATEMLAGKTVAEARSMSGKDLAAPLGALPPVKIHCAQLVESALRSALQGEDKSAPVDQPKETKSPTLLEQFSPSATGKVKIVLATDEHG